MQPARSYALSLPSLLVYDRVLPLRLISCKVQLTRPSMLDLLNNRPDNAGSGSAMTLASVTAAAASDSCDCCGTTTAEPSPSSDAWLDSWLHDIVDPAVTIEASQLVMRCSLTLHAPSALCTARIKHLLVVITIPF